MPRNKIIFHQLEKCTYILKVCISFMYANNVQWSLQISWSYSKTLWESLEISGISGISGIFPEFRGENSGGLLQFQAVVVCRYTRNTRFSGNAFRDFPEFPEISGNFPKMSGISPGFRGENSGGFSRFQAVIVCKRPQTGRFSGDDFRDFPEFPEFPENFRKIPEFRNFRNPKNSRNFRKFPATGFF